MRRMLFISAQRMDDEEMKSQQPRVACFSRREMICFRRGDDKYGRKKYYFQAPQRKRSVSVRSGREGFCYPSGSIPLGKRGDGAGYGYFETAVEAV